MTIYVTCTEDLPTEAIKVRWQEPYITAGLNQKTLGQQARGVFTGFNVIPAPGIGVSFGVILDVDPVLGFSGANILDTTSRKYCVTLIQESPITVFLDSVANGTVYITLDAQYQIGATSAAQVKVVDAAELLINPNLVLLAKVDVPANTAIPMPASAINMGYRLSAGDSITQESLPAINLLPNGNFERDAVPGAPTGWSSSGGGLALSADGTIFHSGSKSMKLEAAGAVTLVAVSQPMIASPGVKYRVEGWIRAGVAAPIAGAGTGVTLQVDWITAAGATISTSNIEAPFKSASLVFEERKAEVTAPATTATARYKVSFDNVSGVLYLDDAKFSARRWESSADAVIGYSGGPNWADGTTNPPTTVEAQLDKIVTDLAGAAGAAKLGFAPTTPVDLTATRVDTALNELDDKKSGIGVVNTFTKRNIFNNTTANTPAIDATGNGTGNGVNGRGGNTDGAGVRGDGTNAGEGVVGFGGATSGRGVVGFGGAPNGAGGDFTGDGNGAGVVATGGDTNAAGVVGQGGAANGVGVRGNGTGLGRGVEGYGGSGIGAGGVYGLGSSHILGGPGVEGYGTVTGAGGQFIGGPIGPSSSVTSADGVGVLGMGGAGDGNGVYGLGDPTAGTIGTISTMVKNAGVLGVGSGSGIGVVGISAGTSGAGVHGGMFIGADGFDTNGVVATGKQAGHGGIFNGGATGNALRIGAGHAAFIGTNPASTVAFTNTATPTSIVKAWARITCTGGTQAITSGFNVSSLTDIDFANGAFFLELASNVEFDTRIVQVFVMRPIGVASADFGAGDDNSVAIVINDMAGANRDLTAGTTIISVVVYGPQ